VNEATEESIMALQHIRGVGITAAMAGLGAVLAGCAAQSAPLALACEPNQRAIVRQVTVNGVSQPQLECSSSAPAMALGGVVPAAYTAAPAAVPITYYTQAPIADAQYVRAAYQPAVITRPVAPPRVAYQPARRLVAAPKRTVAKSAVIIGSSAGAGAGIGAAIGGKKGAGIGALVAGGGAALWDQLTRRR
jgi:hypothetical protein